MILIVDLIIRSVNLTAHYTDYGVLPRDIFLTNFHYENMYYSIHLMSGEPIFIALLFIAAGVFAIGYMIGYKTRACALLSFILLVSLHNRNPVLLHGGDTYLRVLLFWSMFLPINTKWSVDNVLKPKNPNSVSITSFGSVALLMQIISLYVFSALLKDHPIWTRDFTAIYYALSVEQFTTPLGLELLKYPLLMKFLTALTLYLEKYGMLIFFIPFFNGQIRALGVSIFLIFHMLGINTMMELGIFHYVCSAALLVFIPAWFWERLLPKVSAFLSKYQFFKELRSYFQLLLVKRKQFIGTNKKLTAYSIKLSIYKKIRRWIVQGTALLLCIYTLLWNLRELNLSIDEYLPYNYNNLARALRIDQRWDMFAPYPMMEDGWFVISATLNDGSQIDLFKNEAPVNYSKPKNVSAQYKDERWRKYMMKLWNSNYRSYRKYFLDYLYADWYENSDSEKEIKDIEMVFMLEVTPSIGEEKAIPERVSLLKISYEDEF
ncbi:hypothetical protein A8C32_05985 [Flavivirga aquatica]|uniref:HTTM-like domain-containing protein n=2 Tax=Flavivirga aquatica TaxID=1849968 RepID=A0A1E5SI05_9FLAO|nr:hypothetical protein A8C32_05985 [Flavivirga aquatica]